jgi:hypothetical protein
MLYLRPVFVLTNRLIADTVLVCASAIVEMKLFNRLAVVVASIARVNVRSMQHPMLAPVLDRQRTLASLAADPLSLHGLTLGTARTHAVNVTHAPRSQSS